MLTTSDLVGHEMRFWRSGEIRHHSDKRMALLGKFNNAFGACGDVGELIKPPCWKSRFYIGTNSLVLDCFDDYALSLPSKIIL